MPKKIKTSEQLTSQERQSSEQEQLINLILEKRRQKVPLIEEKIGHLQSLKKELDSYNQLRNKIVDADGNLKSDSPFSAQLTGSPAMVKAIKEATTDELEKKIASQIKEWEKLKKRFNRDAISIQVFGLAGSGKSRFIQTVSGLDNRTVLASEGNHTTGATSYIRNAQSFEAHIFPYSKEEILAQFNSYLKSVLENIGEPPFSLDRFEEIGEFDYSAHNMDKIEANKMNSIRAYTSKFQDICSVFEELSRRGVQDEETGLKYFKVDNPDDVQPYVAHHNGKRSSEDGYVEHGKYMAVKYVRVFNQFLTGNAARIELMDTVGLGDKTNENLVLQNVYDAIEENCDLVVQIFSPAPDAVWRQQYSETLERLESIHYRDMRRQIERISDRCLFLVLNKKQTATNNNEANVKEAQKLYIQDEYKPDLLVADCSNLEDTRTNVIEPILRRMSQCLEDIDKVKASQANFSGKDVYKSYKEFREHVGSVLLEDPSLDLDNVFQNSFQDTLLPDIQYGLKDVLYSLVDDDEGASDVLKLKLEKKHTFIQSDVFMDTFDNLIDDAVRRNVVHKVNAFYEVAAEIRHVIPQQYRCIDEDIQKHVEICKAKVFNLLYEKGCLGQIMKKSAIEGQPDYITTNQWMRSFVQSFIKKDDLSRLNEVMTDLLDFKIDIDGFLLHHIQRHMRVFDNCDTTEISDRNDVKALLEESLYNAYKGFIKDSDNKERGILEDVEGFADSVDDAIYFAIDEFVGSFLYNRETYIDLRKLYYRNRILLWNTFSNVDNSRTSFMEWRKQLELLSDFNNPTKFYDEFNR